MYEDKKKNSLKKIEKKDLTLEEITRVRPAAASAAIAPPPAPRAARAGADPRASRAARRRSSTRTSSRGSRS